MYLAVLRGGSEAKGGSVTVSWMTGLDLTAVTVPVAFSSLLVPATFFVNPYIFLTAALLVHERGSHAKNRLDSQAVSDSEPAFDGAQTCPYCLARHTRRRGKGRPNPFRDKKNGGKHRRREVGH